MLLTLSTSADALGRDAPKREGITRQRADEILSELKQIRALLEKLDKEGVLRGSNPAADERVKVKIDDRYALGRQDAPLTLVEFADYQCPFCKEFESKILPELQKHYIDTGTLRFVALDLPLATHANASHVAEAALCAGEQYRFWEMRDALMKDTSALGDDAIQKHAAELHLDTTLFQNCLASNRYQSKIAQDIARAASAGISATPSFVLARTTNSEIEGIRLIGSLPYPEFDSKLTRLLERETVAPVGGRSPSDASGN